MSFLVGKDGIVYYVYGINEKFDYVVYYCEGLGWICLMVLQVGVSFVFLESMLDGYYVYVFFSVDGGFILLVEMFEMGGDCKVFVFGDFGSVDDIEWMVKFV